MTEAHLPSGDPLSTRTRPGEGSRELGVRHHDLAIDIFDERDEPGGWPLDDARTPILEDSDLRR